jgi:hypothetical protein
MATECDGSSSATIYFRAKGAGEYEKFYTENCPVAVRVDGGGPFRSEDGLAYRAIYGCIFPFTELNLDEYGTNRRFDIFLFAPFGQPYAEYWNPGGAVSSQTRIYFPDGSGLWQDYPLAGSTIYSDDYEPLIPSGFRLIQVYDIYTDGRLLWDALTGGQEGGSKITIVDSQNKTFEKSFNSEIEWYSACDCEEGCLPIYADEDFDFFICLCAEEDDEDIEKMKERIKQELLVELPPIIKSQLQAELVPELVQQLPENETFKGKVVDSVKAALAADDAFKNGIKDAVKTALLADAEFKTAMSTATKERFVSDLPYQKEWIDIIAAAIKAKADGDANGYPMDVGGVEVRVKQLENVPQSLSFAAGASLTSSAIEDALAAKYGGAWHTSGYATANGKTTANITQIS